MTDKPMFADVEKGTRLWNFRYGWAKIVELPSLYPTNRLVLENEKGNMYMCNLDGRIDEYDLNPSWFYNEVKITPPERPEPEPCDACKWSRSIEPVSGHSIHLHKAVTTWLLEQHCTCENKDA